MLQHPIIPTKTMEAVDTSADTPVIADEKDAVRNAEEIGAVAEAVGATMI